MTTTSTTTSATTATPAPAAAKAFELGLYSFVENTPDPSTGERLSPARRLANLLEEIELADQVGLDVYGIGEHHRQEYLASAPAIILAAAASRTRNIRLASAVTVLSSDDPVRVWQQFATLDLLSGGRAEIVAGRGSFIESFPLFGYDLRDYSALFEEKLELLLQLRAAAAANVAVRWPGGLRAAIDNLPVFPPPLQQQLPIWVAVGGTPESVVRAAKLGLPLALAIIGGEPARFKPLVDLYWRVASQAGHDLGRLAVSINSHGFLADSLEAASQQSFPSVAAMMNTIGRERGWPPLTRAQYHASAGLHGHLALGDPAMVAEKILFQHQALGHQRYTLQLSVGSLPHRQLLHAIELYGTQVAPVVRAEVARRNAKATAALA
jgi:probable LLM family oxidoreductase